METRIIKKASHRELHHELWQTSMNENFDHGGASNWNRCTHILQGPSLHSVSSLCIDLIQDTLVSLPLEHVV